MNILVTGGAGFIGSKLTEELLKDVSNNVVVVDNFVLGKRDLMEKNTSNSRFKYFDHDVTDIDYMTEVIRDNKINHVYHLAANSDIQKGGKEPSIDFHDTFLTTYSVLEAMRLNGVKNLFFASTSAIYGELVDVNLHEDLGGLKPISYYGGAKYASEAFISSYAYMNNMNVLVFRFPNVIGPNLTHGVIFDFINKLKNNPTRLEILGDGKQSKPYIYVEDLVSSIIEFSKITKSGMEIFNIGVEDSISVTEIADTVCSVLGLNDVKYEYTGGDRGWKGDIPRFQFDLAKIKKLGYVIKNNSKDAVRKTVESVVKGN